MALEFRRQVIADKEQVVDAINDTQEQIFNIVRVLNKSPTVTGVLLKNITIGSTPTLVRHGLGYNAQGWIVTNKSANFEVYQDISVSNPDASQFIYLRTSSGSYTVNILFI
jgi:hypothetical protein